MTARFRGRIPVSLADITGKAAMIAADLEHHPDRADAERLAAEHHSRAADAGWAPAWDELTPAQRDRATMDALPYLRALRRIESEAADVAVTASAASRVWLSWTAGGNR